MDQQQQTTEVENTTIDEGATQVTQQTVTSKTSAHGRTVLIRTVWFVVEVIVVLLLIRVVLYLLGANQGSPFVDFLYAISAPFAAPFYGIFKQPEYGKFVFDTASVVGAIVYGIIGWIVTQLFTLTSSRREV